MIRAERNPNIRWVAVRVLSGRSHIDEVNEMIIPVRCFSCGHVIGHLWERYSNGLKEGRDANEMLDEVGLERYCCRRMFVSHVELIDDIAPFSVAQPPE